MQRNKNNLYTVRCGLFFNGATQGFFNIQGMKMYSYFSNFSSENNSILCIISYSIFLCCLNYKHLYIFILYLSKYIIRPCRANFNHFHLNQSTSSLTKPFLNHFAKNLTMFCVIL